MKVKSSEETPSRPRRPQRRGKRRILAAIAVVILLAWTALVFMGGIAFLDFVRPSILTLTGTTSTRDAAVSVSGAPYRWARAWLADEAVDRLHIDIKFKHLHKLHEKRDEALAIGLLQTGGDDFVPAEIRHGDETVRVKLRLKGDYTDHLEGEKWSLRIHVRKNQNLFGMRRFSIQAPRTRAFQAEPVVLDHFRREGVLAPRYFFTNVSLNGNDIGLMAVEESFSKELLESQQRREGVILRFHEDPFFANAARNGIHGPYENFFVARITPFQESTVAESPRLSAQRDIGIGMLRGFLEGRMTTSEVFDVEQMSRFLAVAEVWGVTHGLRWHNLRFYLNPITLRLEPIAFDLNMQVTYVGPGLVTLHEPFPRLLLEDPEMREAFVKHVRRIARQVRDGSLAKHVAEIEAPMLRVLNREFPLRRSLQTKRLERRAGMLAAVTFEDFDLHQPALISPRADYPEAIEANWLREPAGESVEFVNVLPVAVIVDTLKRSAPKGGKSEALVLAEGALPLTLPPTELGRPPKPVRVRIEPLPPDDPESATGYHIEGTYQLAGQGRRHAFEAQPYVAAADHHPIETATLDEARARNPFLEWDPSSGRLRAPSGDWLVNGSLVLPPGVGLELIAGTTLRFREGEALIASGPLLFAGTPEAPIVLQGAHADSLWGGIIAFQSDEPHRWKNVIVRHTSGIARGGWVLTGGVTLRDASVRIEDSLFESNQCEDALNLVRSEFELIDVRFRDTPSDAFDGDFVTGRVVGGSYEGVGGDGIDVSGADVVIENVQLRRIHDKALSLGESSHARISGVRVDGAGTAVASKDASITEVSDSEFNRIEYTAIMAYVKKPVYGPSQIVARDITFREVGSEALAQRGSRVTLNGVEITPTEIDIDALYESGHMRK